jgi:transcriptional regulator with XRE-family HTH domain
MNPYLSQFGLRLQMLRQRRNHTQYSLAAQFQRLGLPITRWMLANYESGRSDVQARFIPIIAHILGVPVASLLPPLSPADARKLATKSLFVERRGRLRQNRKNLRRDHRNARRPIVARLRRE